MSRKPLIAGNWKMNLNHLEAIAVVQKLAFMIDDKDFDAVDVVVIPPFTDMRSVQTLIDGDRLRFLFGAQDLSPKNSGAFTGDISGVMLAKLGCSFVIVGHSERREHHNEDDSVVNSKLKAALANGLSPILCIGESAAIRSENGQVAHVIAQLKAGLHGITPAQLKKIVIAYEPIWAIGSGNVATPEDAQNMAEAIRDQIRKSGGAEIGETIRILYGGSVKSGTIREIMAGVDVDGALVGGASLEPEEFARIVKFQR